MVYEAGVPSAIALFSIAVVVRASKYQRWHKTCYIQLKALIFCLSYSYAEKGILYLIMYVMTSRL